jgi:hypothetical protein
MLTPVVVRDIAAYRSQQLLDEAEADRLRRLARHGRHRGPLSPRRWRVVLAAVVALVALSAGGALASRPPAAGPDAAPPSEAKATYLPAAAVPLATTFDGPASCASPGFLTGDTVGDANPAALYAALCR